MEERSFAYSENIERKEERNKERKERKKEASVRAYNGQSAGIQKVSVWATW